MGGKPSTDMPSAKVSARIILRGRTASLTQLSARVLPVVASAIMTDAEDDREREIDVTKPMNLLGLVPCVAPNPIKV